MTKQQERIKRFLKTGDKVRVQDSYRRIWEKENIIKKLDQPRSCTVKIHDKIVTRNQIHIRTGTS